MTELASVKRLGWSPYLGKTDTLHSRTLLGRYPVKVQDFWIPALDALEAALAATGYENPCDWIGSYKKRYIANTTIWSWHSYGGAIDLDYGGDNPASPDHPLFDRNPHLRRRIYPNDPGFGTEFQLLEHQVRAIEAIRTVNGKRPWRWLGWSIGDTMHFEPNCSRSDIETGIATTEEATMWPTLGDTDNATLRRFDVEAWQLKLATVAGHPYTTGSTATVITAAGMLRGTYDDAMKALVAGQTSTSGAGIGPREGALIDNQLVSDGVQGPRGPQGPPGVDGKTPVIEVTYE